jgi:hypothetical protein
MTGVAERMGAIRLMRTVYYGSTDDMYLQHFFCGLDRHGRNVTRPAWGLGAGMKQTTHGSDLIKALEMLQDRLNGQPPPDEHISWCYRIFAHWGRQIHEGKELEAEVLEKLTHNRLFVTLRGEWRLAGSPPLYTLEPADMERPGVASLLEDSSLHFIPPPDKKTLGEMNSHGSTNYTYLFEKLGLKSVSETLESKVVPVGVGRRGSPVEYTIRQLLPLIQRFIATRPENRDTYTSLCEGTHVWESMSVLLCESLQAVHTLGEVSVEEPCSKRAHWRIDTSEMLVVKPSTSSDWRAVFGELEAIFAIADPAVEKVGSFKEFAFQCWQAMSKEGDVEEVCERFDAGAERLADGDEWHVSTPFERDPELWPKPKKVVVEPPPKPVEDVARPKGRRREYFAALGIGSDVDRGAPMSGSRPVYEGEGEPPVPEPVPDPMWTAEHTLEDEGEDEGEGEGEDGEAHAPTSEAPVTDSVASDKPAGGRDDGEGPPTTARSKTASSKKAKDPNWVVLSKTEGGGVRVECTDGDTDTDITPRKTGPRVDGDGATRRKPVGAHSSSASSPPGDRLPVFDRTSLPTSVEVVEWHDLSPSGEGEGAEEDTGTGALPSRKVQSNAVALGKWGESCALQLLRKGDHFKGATLQWENETVETGSPYDICVIKNSSKVHFIEVKTTTLSAHKKHRFEMSSAEVAFAREMGARFSVIRIVLHDPTHGGVSAHMLDDVQGAFDRNALVLQCVEITKGDK